MKTILQAMNAALLEVAATEGAGLPMHGGAEVDPEEGLAEGVAPDAIAWTGDRGNWSWDGALAAFRVLGVDCSKPVSEIARFAR